MASTPKAVMWGALAGLVVALATWNLLRFGSVTGTPQQLAQAPDKGRPLPPPPLPARDHNYDMKDGLQYGYTTEVSEAQRQAGQVGANIVMFRYAGEHDGVHQLHVFKGSVLQALECRAPCEVVKIMTVMDMDGARSDVQVQRLRNQPGMVAGLALADAIDGKLQSYAEIYGVKRFEVWVDERKGISRTRLKDASAAEAEAANKGSL